MTGRLLSGLFLIFCSLNVYAAINNPLQQLVDTQVKKYLTSEGVNGIALAIHYQGQDYFFNYGFADANRKVPVTKDTIFDLISISKVITTTMLAIEVQADKIKLKDPITKYIPELVNTHNLPIDDITVQELATHTASFPRDAVGLGKATGKRTVFIEQLKQWKPTFPIGSKYHYSNLSIDLLGIVLEGATGQSYMSLLSNTLLQPLNMTHTFVDIPSNQIEMRAQGFNKRGLPEKIYHTPYLIGGSSLRSSTSDLLQFLRANLNIPTINATPELLKAMQLAQQPYFTNRRDFVMALGWQRIKNKGNLYITKNGGNIGFATFIGFSPDKKFGVVILTNRSGAKTGYVGWELLKALDKGQVADKQK